MAPNRNTHPHSASSPTPVPTPCPAPSTSRIVHDGTSGHNETAPSPTNNQTPSTTRNPSKPNARDRHTAASLDSPPQRWVASTAHSLRRPPSSRKGPANRRNKNKNR